MVGSLTIVRMNSDLKQPMSENLASRMIWRNNRILYLQKWYILIGCLAWVQYVYTVQIYKYIYVYVFVVCFSLPLFGINVVHSGVQRAESGSQDAASHGLLSLTILSNSGSKIRKNQETISQQLLSWWPWACVWPLIQLESKSLKGAAPA